MNRTSILAILLAALMLFSTVGCSFGGTEETTDTTVSETHMETETEDPLQTVLATFSDRDYEGYSFRVGDRPMESGWGTTDVSAEEITGEAINDAVYNRNTALEETLNITVQEIRLNPPYKDLQSSVIAGADDYDTITDGIDVLSILVTDGYLIDFNAIDAINPSARWWDAALYENSSIFGKSYMMTGDISIMDNVATWCLLFNKDIIRDYGLENPYMLVEEGTWTLDKMDEMASKVLNDTNGDGAWTDVDVYGLVTESYNTLAFWSCLGFRINETGSDGNLYYSYRDEEKITALMEVIDINYSEYSNIGISSTVGTNAEHTRERQFSIGGALFYFAGMCNITRQREYDIDFGVLPAPKYTEAQKEYYSSYSYCNFTAYCIPITCHDQEKIGDILEAMAQISLYTLTPAYYDQTLIGKSTRDEESEPMIDLILATRNFDLGLIYDIGRIRTSIIGMKDSSAVVSKLTSLEQASDKALEEFVSNAAKES